MQSYTEKECILPPPRNKTILHQHGGITVKCIVSCETLVVPSGAIVSLLVHFFSFLIRAINLQKRYHASVTRFKFWKKQQRKVISDRFCISVILTIISILFRGWLLVQESIVSKETWPLWTVGSAVDTKGFLFTVLSGWEAPFPSARSPEVSSNPLTPQGPSFR